MNTNMEAITWALHARGLDPVAWKILMKLANRVNSERRDFDVWPSVAQIAEDAEVSTATVKRHLPVLVDEGYIEIIPRARPNGGSSSNCYRLLVRKTIQMPKGDVVIDASAMDREMSWGGAQIELGGGLTGEPRSEPLKDRTYPIEHPPSPDGEGTPVEKDLLGDPILSAEQLKALAEDELVKFVETEWHKVAAESAMTTDIEEIDTRRRRAVLTRAAEKVRPDRTARMVWDQIFEQIRASTHLRGLGKPGKDRTEPWAADFDWLIGPKNFGKVLEGKYRDRRHSHSSFDGSGKPLTAVDAAARDVASRIRASRARSAGGGNSGGARPAGRTALPGQ